MLPTVLANASQHVRVLDESDREDRVRDDADVIRDDQAEIRRRPDQTG